MFDITGLIWYVDLTISTFMSDICVWGSILDTYVVDMAARYSVFDISVWYSNIEHLCRHLCLVYWTLM